MWLRLIQHTSHERYENQSITVIVVGPSQILKETHMKTVKIPQKLETKWIQMPPALVTGKMFEFRTVQPFLLITTAVMVHESPVVELTLSILFHCHSLGLPNHFFLIRRGHILPLCLGRSRHGSNRRTGFNVLY